MDAARILHDGHLVGRVDAKAHRAERRLEVRHVHFEPWVAEGTLPPVGQARLDESAVMAGVGDALASLANFVSADRVMLGRVTPARLLAPLDGGAAGRGQPTSSYRKQLTRWSFTIPTACMNA